MFGSLKHFSPRIHPYLQEWVSYVILINVGALRLTRCLELLTIGTGKVVRILGPWSPTYVIHPFSPRFTHSSLSTPDGVVFINRSAT